MSAISHLANAICLAGALAPAMALSGDALPVTDLSMSVSVSPVQALYPPGSVVRVDYTVHNAGPDDAPGSYSAAGEFAINGPNSQIAMAWIEQTEPCAFAALHFDAPTYFHGAFVTTLTYPPIAADTSVTCSLQFEVLDTARGIYIVRGAAGPMVSGATSTDPNLDNNVALIPMQLSEGPPPSTDIALSLELVPARPIYPSGSEVRLRVTMRNNGPDGTRGSRVTFDPSWATDPNAPAAIMHSPLGDEPPQCMYSAVESQTSLGYTVDRLTARYLASGESLTCEHRFLVLDSAPASFTVSAVSTPVPDFGDPTADPVPENDTATLTVRTAPAVVARPAVVPALNMTLLTVLVVSITALGAWMLGRFRN